MMQANQDLKTELLSQIEALGQQRSLVPFSETLIDEIIRKLEKINPITQPLQPSNFDSLLGEWQLIYASNGTVVTRPIAEITNILGSGIKVKRIWQSLTVKEQKITAYNKALIQIFLLGEYQLSAEGIWQPEPDELTAKVTFNTFSGQATQFLGQPSWTLPEVKIPILDFLRNEALWITSFLDEDMRIGRGATGNLFVFRK